MATSSHRCSTIPYRCPVRRKGPTAGLGFRLTLRAGQTGAYRSRQCTTFPVQLPLTAQAHLAIRQGCASVRVEFNSACYLRDKRAPRLRAAALPATRETFRISQPLHRQFRRVRTNSRLSWETRGCSAVVSCRCAYKRHSQLHIGALALSALRCASVHSDE